MKRNILIALILLCSVSLFAKYNYSNEVVVKANKMTELAKVKLNLNQAQTTELQAINMEAVKRMDDALKISNIDSLQNAVQAINTYREQELKKILTPQQFIDMQENVNGRQCYK